MDGAFGPQSKTSSVPGSESGRPWLLHPPGGLINQTILQMCQLMLRDWFSRGRHVPLSRHTLACFSTLGDSCLATAAVSRRSP